jgi:hypothetical protein
VLVTAATGAGWLARQASRLPGVAGGVLGVAAAWDGLGRPAALATAAVLLLILDRRAG